MSQQTQLPSNPLAEQGVLAAILFQPYLIAKVADTLKPGDFYFNSLRHREIYQAMLHLYQQEIEIDTATISEQLQRAGITDIKDKNVMSYIGELWRKGLNELPSVTDDAKLVQNCSTLRDLHEFIGKAGEVLGQEPDAQKALEKLQGMLSSINEDITTSDLKPLSQIMDAFLADLDIRQSKKGGLTGVPTGLDDLDRYLGGLQKGEFIVLGGEPGSGKTSLMLTILYYLITRLLLHVAVFSVEMPANDLAMRLISMDSEIDSQLLRTRWLEDWQIERVVNSACDHLYKEHVYIDDSGDLTIAAMQAKLDRYKAQHGLDAVLVDYLQLMQYEDDGKGGNRYENENVQLSKISRGLKKIAKRFNVPVLAVVSLNQARAGRSDKRHQLSDIYGTGSIRFDSDVIMFIQPSQEREGYSLVDIAKHRNGPVQRDIPLKFDASLTRFSNIEETGQYWREESK